MGAICDLVNVDHKKWLSTYSVILLLIFDMLTKLEIVIRMKHNECCGKLILSLTGTDECCPIHWLNDIALLYTRVYSVYFRLCQVFGIIFLNWPVTTLFNITDNVEQLVKIFFNWFISVLISFFPSLSF